MATIVKYTNKSEIKDLLKFVELVRITLPNNIKQFGEFTVVMTYVHVVLHNGVYIGHIEGVSKNIRVMSNTIVELASESSVVPIRVFALSRSGVFEMIKDETSSITKFKYADRAALYYDGSLLIRVSHSFGVNTLDTYTNMNYVDTTICEKRNDIPIILKTYYETTYFNDVWTLIKEKIQTIS